MIPRTLRVLVLPALFAAAVLAAPRARAESHDPQCLAFGWLTENADAVVTAIVSTDRGTGEGGTREVTLAVEESIRGPLGAGAPALVLFPDVGEGRPYVLGERHLAFLRALPERAGEPRRWGLLSGSFGIRPIPASGPESRFPGICRAVAGVLDAKGAVRDATAYRALLVEGIEDGDAGVAWSAATDLVRHAEMHAALTPEERGRVVAAFDRQPVGKDTKKALALAVAATRDPSAGPALVNALLRPRAREIRLEVGEAVRRLESPEAVALLLKALEGADPATRADLLNVLGIVAPPTPAAAAAARAGLADADPVVRIEAAHALGLMVREQHRADPEAPLAGRKELLATLATAPSENEQLALVWSLAQIDEPESYEALRRLAASDARPLVRMSAERYLANPRLSLVLR